MPSKQQLLTMIDHLKDDLRVSNLRNTKRVDNLLEINKEMGEKIDTLCNHLKVELIKRPHLWEALKK